MLPDYGYFCFFGSRWGRGLRKKHRTGSGDFDKSTGPLGGEGVEIVERGSSGVALWNLCSSRGWLVNVKYVRQFVNYVQIRAAYHKACECEVYTPVRQLCSGRGCLSYSL